MFYVYVNSYKTMQNQTSDLKNEQGSSNDYGFAKICWVGKLLLFVSSIMQTQLQIEIPKNFS